MYSYLEDLQHRELGQLHKTVYQFLTEMPAQLKTWQQHESLATSHKLLSRDFRGNPDTFRPTATTTGSGVESRNNGLG